MMHIGYKKIQDDFIVKLRIDGLNNELRSTVKRQNSMTAKYRCSTAFVLDIYKFVNGEKVNCNEGYGVYDKTFHYKVGEKVEVVDYDKDINKVCTKGIHYFLSEEPAFFYNMRCKGYTGLYEIWFENGQLKYRITYKNGLIDGLYERWNENGQLVFRSTYKNGEVDGLYEEWYENGQLEIRWTYKNNLRDGLYESWHENGQLSIRCTYKNGLKDGLYEEWYPNGQLSIRCTY